MNERIEKTAAAHAAMSKNLRHMAQQIGFEIDRAATLLQLAEDIGLSRYTELMPQITAEWEAALQSITEADSALGRAVKILHRFDGTI